jgi:hypothetical protein
MGLIKKVNVQSHFAARRGVRTVRAEEASKQISIDLETKRPVSAATATAEFLQDFALEHSSRGAAASAKSRLSESPRVRPDSRKLPA